MLRRPLVMSLLFLLLAGTVWASDTEKQTAQAAAQRLFEKIALGLAPSGRSAPVQEATNAFKLQMIPEDLTEYLHARCLDGSPYGFYIRRALSRSARDKWVLYLQGGGLCVTQVDCEERLKGDQGSSIWWQPIMADTDNVVSRDKRSPYYDWNHVYLKYCSGDTWTGTNTESPGLFSLFFSGFNNILATVATLTRSHGFDTATDLVFAGSSAGAIGVNNNCDFMAAHLTGVNVRCISLSGLFFPRNTTALWLDRAGVGNLTAEIGSLYVTSLFDSHLDESCLMHARVQGDPYFLCWDAAYLVPHIRTKIFFAQNMWDSIQLKLILCRKDLHHMHCPDDFLHDFKRHTIETIDLVAQGRDDVGYWIPSCFAHNENTCMLTDTVVNNYGLCEALREWEDDRTPAPRLVDSCVSPLPGVEPCNPVCHGCGPETPGG